MIKKLLFAVFISFSISQIPLLGSNQPLEGQIIVVDAGHGTINYQSQIINGGKETRRKTPEHRLTLEIAEKTKKVLDELGATVYLTRSWKDYWRPSYNSVDDNKARAIFANELNADMLISVHCDWHPKRSVHGLTTLYAKNDSRRFASAVHRSMVKYIKGRDRKTVQDDFTILDNAKMPAIIVETGFMSHWNESKKLEDPEHQKKIAKALSKGILNYVKSNQ